MSAAPAPQAHTAPPIAGAARERPSIEGEPAFLDCPAYLDQQDQHRCGLPAEVRRRYITDSTSGPVEHVVIRCPARHFFNGPIEFLILESHPADLALSANEKALQEVSEPDLELIEPAGSRICAEHPSCTCLGG